MSLTSDLRTSLRSLKRSPLFTTVAVLSLGLGIGANTAIFSLVDQLLLRRLPVQRPEELVMIWPKGGTHLGNNRGTRMMSYPMYQDFQKKAEPFSEVMCRRITQVTVAFGGPAERVLGEMVSGNYFTMLGVRPAVGRLFSSEDDRLYKGHPVAVLSYPYWVTRFAGDKGIIGKTIRVNSHPMVVVGVSAPEFGGMDPASTPQVYVPIQMSPLMTPGWDDLGNRRSQWVQMFARLKPGFTPERAQAAAQTLFLQVRRMELADPALANVSQYYRNRFLETRIQVEAIPGGYSEVRQDFSTALKVLMCMVGLVLLIACLNVANLSIARGLARSRELATRLAVGASRWRLMRPILVESLLLSFTGAALGLPLAYATVRGLLSVLPQGDSIPMLDAAPDFRILLFTAGAAVIASLIFGMTPALHSVRVAPWTALKNAGGAATGGGRSVFLRKLLVTVQVAFSFVLLAGAAIFVKSLDNLKQTETGFREMDNLVTFRLDPDLNGYDVPRIRDLYGKVLEAIRATPGVRSAGHALVPLLSGSEWDSSMSVEGHRMQDGEDMQAFMNMISPGYWDAMGIPMLDGRDFDERDVGKETTVAIVNRRFAEHFFPKGDAVGRMLGRGTRPGTALTIKIVGVVENSLYEGPREGVHRQVFVPSGQVTFPASTSFYVRAGVESEALAATLRKVIAKVDPSVPISRMQTLEGQLDDTLAVDRLTARLSTAFGILAAILATIGLYGVMAFSVVRRTKELGLRMALGAQPRAIVGRVMREVAILLAAGLAIGAPASYLLSRYVSSQLYGLKGIDPVTLCSAAAVLAAAALLSGFLPARRAAAIDPIQALRYE